MSNVCDILQKTLQDAYKFRRKKYTNVPLNIIDYKFCLPSFFRDLLIFNFLYFKFSSNLVSSSWFVKTHLLSILRTFLDFTFCSKLLYYN